MKSVFTKFVPASSTRASKVIAKDDDNHKLIQPWRGSDGVFENHRAAASEFLEVMNWSGHMIGSEGKLGYVWIFCDVQFQHTHNRKCATKLAPDSDLRTFFQ